MTVTYSQWQGHESATYVIRAARGTRSDPKGERSDQPFLVIPDARLERYEQDLVAQGWTVLSPIRSVEPLSFDERIDLAACLSRTRKQQKNGPEWLGIQVERPLLARCPTFSVAAYELDLTSDLKNTLEGRDRLFEAADLIRDYYRPLGVRLRASWSASCDDPWCEDPNGPRCPHGASGVHLELGLAEREVARPDLGRIMFLEALRVGKRLGLSPHMGPPPGHKGAYLDLSSLHAVHESRGKLLRALGAPHHKSGPKKIMGRWVEGTPLASWWLAEAIEEREVELAAARAKEKKLAAIPRREPRAPLLEATSRSSRSYPETVALLAQYRGSVDRQGLTRALATVLLKLGIDREAGIDLVQAGLQRSERRTVAHVFEDTESKLRAGEQRLAGKGWIVRQNLYSFLVQLASALAQDTGRPFARLYQEVAKVFESAGSTRVQVRAEAVLAALQETHRRLGLEGTHRYAKLLKNLMVCGQAHHELCPTTGTVKVGFCTCKALFCDYCKAYQLLRTVDLAVDMWKAWVAPKELRRTISIAESVEYPTLAEAKRAKRDHLAPIGARWVLGCRGPGRWYYLFLSAHQHSDKAVSMLPGCRRLAKHVSPEEAGDLVAAALLSVHATAQDLFMGESVLAWENFMDEVFGRHLTAGQRDKDTLPWPKKGERLLAGEDYGEAEGECDALCKRYHEHSIVDPSGVTILSKLTGHPPTNKTRLVLSELAGVATPSGRARKARQLEQEAAKPKVGTPYRKRAASPAPARL